MSGVCGVIYNEKHRKASQDLVAKMYNSISNSRRNARTFVHSNIALGGTSHNSSRTDDSSPQVVFEGEIYNLKEINQLLNGNGYESPYHDEPDAIASLYQEYGLDCLKKLRGIFALALWDSARQMLLLATDSFGIMPLNYFFDHEKFIFASKIKGILQCKISPELNHKAILQYLNFTTIPTPAAIFKHIYKLPPGHMLILRNGQTTIRQYWDMEYPELSNSDEYTCAAKLREKIRESVKIHLNYDHLENIGAFLSGGTDSSTVVGMLAEISRKKVKTFSIGFSEERYNETEYARITARHFDTEHYEYFVTPRDVLTFIPMLIKEYDEPFGNSSVIPTYYCARMAKEQGVDVLFAGDGGDELFAGNDRYRTDKIFSLYQGVPHICRNRLVEPILFNLPFQPSLIASARKYVSRSNIPNPRRFFSYGYLLSTDIQEIFTAEFLNTVPQDSLLELPEMYYANVNASSDLNRLLYIDVKMTLTDNDLPKVTRISDFAGVRVRYPLLDQQLAEFTGTIPSHFKLYGFKLRYIFKKALSDFLPDEVLKKKKHGFGLPVSLWLKTDTNLSAFARDTLLSCKCIQRGYFKKKAIENLFAKHGDDRTAYYGDIIWLFLILELWHKEYLDR